jgi:hypothetical protein
MRMLPRGAEPASLILTGQVRPGPKILTTPFDISTRSLFTSDLLENLLYTVLELNMDLRVSQKRLREAVDELGIPPSASFQHSPKPHRDKRAHTSIDSETTQHVLVHRVLCSRVERYHDRHQSSADYFDVPRLLVGANRTTALQGQQALVDAEGFLEDRSGFSFVVYINYRCETYHEKLRQDFTRIRMPHMDHEIESAVKPYFQILQQDGCPATPTSEVMVLSANLEEALQKLHQQHSDSLREWQETEELVYPYPQLYRCKDLFIGASAKTLDCSHQVHLETLYDYLDELLTDDYDEAAALFEAGLVNRKHWAKLFRADEIVVTIKEGQPRAMTMTSSPLHHDDTLALQCWSWEFDGSFFRKDSTTTNVWPSRSDCIAITEVPIYPLGYAAEGLEKRLRSRGRKFWACRKRNYISYDVPLQGLAVQIVSRMRHL